MPKRKSAINCKIKPWLSARPDCREGRFIQVGNSFFLSKSIQSLTPSAERLYLLMAMEAGGNQEFEFPHSAAKKYGISSTTFERCTKELIEAGFIEIIPDENREQYKRNKYRFNTSWKLKAAPHFGDSK